MKFQEIQREIYTNDELCLFLKFHLRISSAACLTLSIIQLYLSSQYNLQFHPFFDMLHLMTEMISILFAILGLVYSFSYITKLQQANCQYYENQNDNISRFLFVAICFTLTIVITLGVMNPIFYGIGMQSKVAQMEHSSYEDLYLLYQSMKSQSNLIIEVIVSAAQTISLIFMGYVFLLFSKNTITYNYFIYVFALIANFVAIIIYSNENDIKSISIINHVIKSNDKYLITYISGVSLFIALIIFSIFLIDTLGQYYRIFKNPIYKFILGNILIGFVFALIGSNGQLIRNLQQYQEIYLAKDECRNQMNLIPSEILEDLGCSKKYFGVQESFQLDCPNEQQTQIWEHKENEKFGCINWNCCSLISQILLKKYISYCLLTNWEAILLIMLSFMLFQIRLVQENAISQTLKQIALLFSFSLIFAGIFAANSLPDIEIYRKTYVSPLNYIPVNNLNTLQTHQMFQAIDWLPQQCSQKVPIEIIQNIKDYCSNQCKLIDLILSIQNGQFLVNTINQKNIIISQEDNVDQEFLYLQGNFKEIIEHIQDNIQVCLFSSSAAIKWNFEYSEQKGQHKHTKQQDSLLIHEQITQIPSKVQQEAFNQLIKYYNIQLVFYQNNFLPIGTQITIYNSLLYNCQSININAEKSILINETNIDKNELAFYNYPQGQYATIIFNTDNYQSCIYIQSNQNIYIHPIIPIQSDLTITLSWFGMYDLDLIVENKICKVGKKYQNECGTIKTHFDSLIGNQQTSTNLSNGEQITIDYLSTYDYKIYVQITLNKEEFIRLKKTQQDNINLYQQSNAQVQIFAKNSRYPQANIFIKQIVQTTQTIKENDKFKYKWFVGCIKNGEVLNVINQIKINYEC
ncbi:unnamed protein product [Paramecium pentaurelia]|uniref:Transmembrane protein n=1 Tax=Paramecium pentaurelia TaxID=43138 RepID=A0A8S1UHF6_9CILI|nr:unnamed protein product [Paramecium pentaurelia]